MTERTNNTSVWKCIIFIKILHDTYGSAMNRKGIIVNEVSYNRTDASHTESCLKIGCIS